MTTGRRRSGSSGEDELLSRLYQQLSDQQAARLGGGYDLAAGLDRYQAWLYGHAAQDQVGDEVIQAGTVMARQASAAGIGGVSSVPGPVEAPTASGSAWTAADARGQIPVITARWDADRAVTALYGMHYRSLVGLAAMLVGDVATAEELVQDSFVALHAGWRRLADGDRALSYLRQAVVNRCRSVLRHRLMTDKHAPAVASGTLGAPQEQVTLSGHSALVSALWTLPPRQREALVLRYYANLSEAQIATTMGISTGTVKSHIARAMSSLQAELRLATE
jgi:RNA polymerase sigma-70 factor (sigma-E family)